MPDVVDVDSATTIENVGAEAGDLSAESDAAVAKLATTAPDAPGFAEVEANAKTTVKNTNVQIGKTLGLNPKFGVDPTYTNQVLEDASGDRTTADGKTLGEFSDSVQKQGRAAVEKIQAENGESGKDIKDSPKTQKTIFEKYGAKALMFASVVGGLVLALVELKKMGDAMTGCYQTLTCSSSESSPVMVTCTNDTVPNQTFAECSCAGVKATSCASPTCDGAGCPNYYWQNVSALQALAGLPGIIAGGLLDPVGKGVSSLLKNIAIYGGIIVLILIIGFVAFKFIERDVFSKGKVSTNIKPTINAKTGFRRK
jgi:hypothetical protein